MYCEVEREGQNGEEGILERGVREGGVRQRKVLVHRPPDPERLPAARLTDGAAQHQPAD